MISKTDNIKLLWQDLANIIEVETCIRRRNGSPVNVGFINQFTRHKTIPNLWFDWKRKVDASIMIIGQDWGPYIELKNFIDLFKIKSKEDKFDYNKFLLETFSSRTEDFIKDVVKETYMSFFDKDFDTTIWNEFIFTVAVLFTRRGKHFRGNRFYDEKFGLEISRPYLERQINIVDPKVIMALGGAAWRSIKDIYGLKNYSSKISDVFKYTKGEPIVIDKKIVIPCFHPACHVTKEEKIKPWYNIWS